MQNSDLKILLVDDEEDILDFVGYNLRKEGYQVTPCNNGLDAIAMAREIVPQLIILDLMMPGMDGIETCRELKKIPSLHDSLIVFFTARNEDYTQILGLESGGDDYITKPIKPAVLVSKINSLLRRHKTVKEMSMVFQAGDLTIDRERFVVLKDGNEILLARKEFELLSLLASKPGRVYTRDEILERVWDKDVIVGERTIDVHIRKIRDKTGSDQIKTIKGVGYKFNA